MFFLLLQIETLVSFFFLITSLTHTHTTHAIPSSISLQKEKQNWSRSLVVCFLYHQEQAECYLCVHKWKPQLSIYPRPPPPPLKENKTKKNPVLFHHLVFLIFSLSLFVCQYPKDRTQLIEFRRCARVFFVVDDLPSRVCVLFCLCVCLFDLFLFGNCPHLFEIPTLVCSVLHR